MPPSEAFFHGGDLPSFSGYCLFPLYVGSLCLSLLPGFLMEGGGGAVSCQGHSTCSWTPYSPSRMTLISSWSAYLGSQDANHIPKASQTIFPPWMESNMCSPFGTKCLSSVSDLPQMTVHRVPIVLPSFSLQRYSQSKPFLLEQCRGRGHLTEPAWMQGQICFGTCPLSPS